MEKDMNSGSETESVLSPSPGGNSPISPTVKVQNFNLERTQTSRKHR